MDNLPNEIVIFENGELKLEVKVAPEQDTVWLNRQQLAALFQTDRTVIGRHIRNIYSAGELEHDSTCAKNAHVPDTRARSYDTEYFNLDMILAIGYKVNAKRGVQFRQWASIILKQYIVQGYAVNDERLHQLNMAIQIMKRSQDLLDAKQILDVVQTYSIALNLLDDYDHEAIRKPQGTQAFFILEYDECKEIIMSMEYSSRSDVFGKEKDESFRSSIAAIYQTYDDVDVYPSLEEKAANLLYFIVKNHSFVDGNKRIAAAIFLYFLERNNALIKNQVKVIDDHTLVALVIMIAESQPQEKEAMINLVMTFLRPVD
ncbi:MAG: virulence protein RhuM/Fic/DOC family protein [Bacillota bacterium]|nr:virulence protein RhuM/Fic/DOC family protein [Bacillota bacterium]